MKNNTIPAIIIALSILAVAFLSRQSGATQVRSILNEIESASQAKDADGKSQVERIASSFVRSTTQGVKSGFEGDKGEVAKEALAVIDKIDIREVKIVESQFKGKERVIGIVRNNSDKVVQNIQLNIIFRNSAGALMDVSSSFSRINGTLKPAAEIGFETDRSIGDSKSTEEDLAKNRSSTAVVTIQSLQIIK